MCAHLAALPLALQPAPAGPQVQGYNYYPELDDDDGEEEEEKPELVARAGPHPGRDPATATTGWRQSGEFNATHSSRASGMLMEKYTNLCGPS